MVAAACVVTATATAAKGKAVTAEMLQVLVVAQVEALPMVKEAWAVA